MEIKHKLAIKVLLRNLPQTSVGSVFITVLYMGLTILAIAAFAPQMVFLGYWVNEGNDVFQSIWSLGCVGLFLLSTLLSVIMVLKSSIRVLELPIIFIYPSKFGDHFQGNCFTLFGYQCVFNMAFFGLLIWWILAILVETPFFLVRKIQESKENWKGLCNEVLEEHTEELSRMEKQRLEQTLSHRSTLKPTTKRL